MIEGGPSSKTAGLFVRRTSKNAQLDNIGHY